MEKEITEKVNKKKIVLKALALIVLLIVVCLVYYIKSGENLPDNERFNREYLKVDKNNIFIYSSQDEIQEAFNSENAIVFFGFPTCKWCQAYVETLNRLAIENGIDEIHYYNIRKDRKENTEFYQNIVEITKEYLELDEEGNPRIYVPETFFIKNGKIIGHNNDVENINELNELIKQVVQENCSDDKQGC